MTIIRLVKKAQKGDDKAFAKLFQQYEVDIYRMAFVYVKNKEDALDVVQDVAYQSFKKIDTLKNPEYFKTWLMRMTINCAINVIRKNRKVVQLKPEYVDVVGVTDADEDIPLSLSLQELLDALNEDEKSVVLLKFYHEYTFQEIAELLQMPLGTAKSITYRSLGKLRKELKGDDLIER